MKIFKKNIFFVGLLVAALLLSSCGMFTDMKMEVDTESEIDEDLIVVGFSQIGSESLWRTANTKSIQTALSSDEGYFLIYKNARQKQENQIKAIREFISQKVDYIIFSPVTETGWDNVLLEAKEAGIPVILVDREVKVEDKSLYTTWIGSDMTEEGRKAGRWLEEQQSVIAPQGGPINIVILLGTEGSTATLGRQAGFLEVAAGHPEWNVLAQEYADFTTAKGKEVMQELLTKYDDIDVLISQNDDMTFGAYEAITEAGKTAGEEGDITIVSFDATRTGLAMVAEGKISLEVECNPLQGKYVDDIIYKMRTGFAIHKKYYVEESLYTKENASEQLGSRTY